MRINFNFTSISVTSLAALGIAAGALIFDIVSSRKEKKRHERFEDALIKDQDRRLRRFDRCVDELDHTDVAVNLTQEIQEKIMYDVATKAIERETLATQNLVRAEVRSEITRVGHDKANEVAKDLESWVKEEYQTAIQSDKSSMLRRVESDIKRDMKNDLSRTLDGFVAECKADVKRVRDTCSDSASEIYKLTKDIREKTLK